MTLGNDVIRKKAELTSHGRETKQHILLMAAGPILWPGLDGKEMQFCVSLAAHEMLPWEESINVPGKKNLSSSQR